MSRVALRETRGTFACEVSRDFRKRCGNSVGVRRGARLFFLERFSFSDGYGMFAREVVEVL